MNLDAIMNFEVTPSKSTNIFIDRNKWIELHTVDRPTGEITKVRFAVGDEAVYGSYNLIYTGTIISITNKTVAVKEPYQNGRTHRLKMKRFIIMNHCYDRDYIREHNASTSQCI